MKITGKNCFNQIAASKPVERLAALFRHYPKEFLIIVFALFFTVFPAGGARIFAQGKGGQPVFIRFKVTEPAAGAHFRVTVGGFRHAGAPWYFPNITTDAAGGAWSAWIDLSDWAWHAATSRSGGVAEYPAVKMTLANLDSAQTVGGCAFDVQLADKPDEKNAVISFTEQSASNAIAFLVPVPLRENAKDFETGSQMTARHAKWATQATGGEPISLKKFDLITQFWGHYDPQLEKQEALTLKMLGFNVIGNLSPPVMRETNLKIYGHTWLYVPDPQAATAAWKPDADAIAGALATDEGRRQYGAMTHFVISDEVSALDFRSAEKSKLDGWFRDYLREKGVTAADIGKPLDQAEYPAKAMFADTLPREASLPERRLFYYAAKFGQRWSAGQLRQTSDLIHASLPQMPTETLLPSHGFLGNAWSAAHIGMSYRNLDFFEVGAQESVNQLSAEDWLGLNHMYGANYTWSGGQTFGYLNALVRSAIAEKPILQRALITPSDDGYLRLKAYSALGQGAKSFFFWTFGPTYIGTENYWSDLKSEYDGIAKLNRALAKSEDVLYPAKPVRDPVAILYSVSHDLWNTDNPAAFAEKRLLWHALRHLQVQPDFLREEDLEAGKLKNYKVLYIADWCVSRRASKAIDEWTRAGGVLYLSAGAATRDEFNEPFAPDFARAVQTSDAAQNLITEKHLYNERIDLPTIKPLTSATVKLNNQTFDLPVIGVRQNLRPNANQFAAFADGATAGATISYGKGKIVAVGFMPMLAYGQLAKFKPTSLEEKWTSEPREIIKIALDAARIVPVADASVPVVEANLLTGANGSALVLENYTYQPVKSLTIDLNISVPVKRAISTEGSPVKLEKLPSGKVRVTVPLTWTDIIIFPKK